MEFETVIGLEVHAQLATNTKIFCRCSTEFGLDPNFNTCPVCLGLPGVLPTINEKAVKFALMLGLATNCDINSNSQFARKNYFYPDLPKAYQTSQFDLPICENGWLDIDVDGKTKRIGITRIHMEEDAGKLVHDGEDENASYVDLNRAGIPLVEIVSEPDIRTSAEAKAYMEKIHSIVTHLEICNGNMEKGNLRCDANVSIRPFGQKEFGIRTETKNLNSFKNVQAAIQYEVARQTDAILDGEKIIQQTRLWDANQKRSKVLRTKEDSDDYRYFPCPDLPRIKLNQFDIDAAKKDLPELPDEKKERYQHQFQLSYHDASILVSDKKLSLFFEKTIALGTDAKIATNWILGEIARLLNEKQIPIDDAKITPDLLIGLIQLIQNNTISGKIAKTVLIEMFETGKKAIAVVEEKGLKQVTDESEIVAICQEIISANQKQVEQYQNGKTKVFGFFVGQVMKQTKGKANPKIVNNLLKDLLSQQ